MAPFQSLGAVSYSHSIATTAASLAILEIFSVNELPDLELKSVSVLTYDKNL